MQRETRTNDGEETFQSTIDHLLGERGTTFARIARHIGLEQVGVVRPGELLRRCASEEGTILGFQEDRVCRALLAKYCSESEEQYQRLLACARHSRRSQRAQQRSVCDSSIRDERELYGIHPERIQAQTGYSYDELLRIEQGKRIASANEQAEIIAVIQRVGEERIRKVLEEASALPRTIRSLVEYFVRKHARSGGGDHYIQFASRIPGVGHELLKYIVRGKMMPALPVVRRIIEAGGAEMTEELVQDWSYEYAEEKGQGGALPITVVFHSLCAEHYQSSYEFYELHGSNLKKSLQRMRRGEACEKKSIDKSLRQLRVKEGSPRWHFVEYLFEEGTVRQAMHRWYQHVCAGSSSISLGYRDLPGLPSQDSPKPLFDRLMQGLELRYGYMDPLRQGEIRDFAFPLIVDGNGWEELKRKVDERWGTILRQDAMVAPLLQSAEAIDPAIVKAGRSRMGAHFRDLVREGKRGEALDGAIQEALQVEGSLQWAMRRYIDTASLYFERLREIAIVEAQKGKTAEEIQDILQIKIGELRTRGHS